MNRLTVFDWERGLLFRQGVIVRELLPGRHTIWTIRGETVQTIRVAPFTVEIDEGPFWTSGMVPVGVRAVATVRVTDVREAFLGDYFARLHEDLRAVIARLMTQIDWTEFASAHARLEADAVDRLSIDARSYGVLVEDVAIPELRLPRRLRRRHKHRIAL